MRPIRRSTENKFLRGLRNLFRDLMETIKNGRGSAKQMNRQVKEFLETPEAEKKIERIIQNMVKSVRVESASSWREAAAKGTNSAAIQKAIMKEVQGPVGRRMAELILENAKYIKSVPKEWAEYITEYTQQEMLKGKRPAEIETELRKIMPQQMHSKLKLIARTESAKANAALCQARAESLGIKAYIWRSAKDERTRHSHSMMDGVLVFYDDPPSPEACFPYKKVKPYGKYHAGNTFNCRCYMEPVVDINFLPDSIRVYSKGSITTMTRNQIRKKFGKIA